MAIDQPVEPRRSRRGGLLAVLFLLLGLLVGVLLGRTFVVSVDPSASPVPTVTVTASPDAGSVSEASGSSSEDTNHRHPHVEEQHHDYARHKPHEAPTHVDGGQGTSGSTDADTGSASGSGGGGSGGIEGGGTGSVDGGRLQDFTMQADLQGTPILLGQQRLLEVRVTNPNDLAITLERITITVQQPSAPGCDPTWLEVDDYVRGNGPAVVVAAGGTRTLLLDAVLVNLATTNQDACQGASFPLSLVGTART